MALNDKLTAILRLYVSATIDGERAAAKGRAITDDGERQFHDDAGIDLASDRDVPEEVMSLLRDLAHVHLPVRRREMTVEVRRETGATIYRCTMTIVGEMVEGL